ncbi:hypothetical protein ACFL23_00370 [Patescibacteria group bacterium]
MGTIIKGIQYLMLKIMKRLRQPDDNRPAIATAEHLLDNKLLPSAFSVFQDSQFRQATGFDKLAQVEQDRIFNELEVATMSLCLFCIEQRGAIVGNKDFHFWKEVSKKIPIQFEQKLLGHGVDKGNAKLFKDLIMIRHEEYEKIFDGSRDYFEEQKDFKDISNKSAKNAFVRAQSVTVGAVDHIRRGKLKQGDSLLRIIRNWLFPLDIEITKFIRKL